MTRLFVIGGQRTKLVYDVNHAEATDRRLAQAWHTACGSGSPFATSARLRDRETAANASTARQLTLGFREAQRGRTRAGGIVAEQRCAGASRGWGGDVPRLTELLLSHPHPRLEGSAWVRGLVVATEALVTDCWDDIVVVAEALLRRESLTSWDLRKVLELRRCA
jgi:hypothetical protein